MKKPQIILVLYYTRGVYPLRDTIATHLYCWRRYSKYRIVYVNIAFGFPWEKLRRMRIAGVIFHTIFLGMRWSPATFAEKTALCAPLAELDVPKIAMPQDEFIRTDMLAEFLARMRITHLYTCAEERDWRKIYGRFLDFSRVKVRTVLTGYIDEESQARIDRMKRQTPGGPRRIDIGYRAWKAAYWLGEHGQHKVRVADSVGASARRRGMVVDSSQREQDVLAGDDWFRFMLDCRATVGVEGGASILDRDGSVKQRVEQYEKGHPGAGFEEVRGACFPGRDGELGLACISPRHLEACGTETCQILIEGGYNGILQPWQHYIPVAKDYGDVERALDALEDQSRVKAMVKRAYDAVVASGRWTYRAFVAGTESEVFDGKSLPRMNLGDFAGYWYFRMRDWLQWRFIRAEVKISDKQPLSRLDRWIYRKGERMLAAAAPPTSLARERTPERAVMARPRVCILSLSAIADDPRVRREGDAFDRAEWDVTGIGLPGARSPAPKWTIRHERVGGETGGTASAASPLSWREILKRNLPAPVVNAIRFAGRCYGAAPLALPRLVRALRWRISGRVDAAAALREYWSWPSVQRIYADAHDLSAEVWLANDWLMLPIAQRLAQERGGIYGYDTHELAVEEYAEKWQWRIFRRPLVQAIEGHLIGGAAIVSAVSPGIAAHLAALYDLKAPPIAIRNVPGFVPVARRATGARIRVLYHGIVAPGRGLEAAIDSVAAWRAEFDLTIRGPGGTAYLQALQTRIERAGMARRITLAPPVPMVDLVREAAAFDIGFFALPGHSRHNVFALPNKFFEYAMAGLALCISDLPEMTRLLRQYDMGVSIAAVTPEAIAASINALDRASIDRYRGNALAAARELCWDRESERLVSAYRRALDRLFPAQEPAAS